MPRPSWEWFDEIERLLERKEISPKEYERNIRILKPTLRIWKDKTKRPILSPRFPSLAFWKSDSVAKSDSYRRRIESYLKRHPTATLKEARGHG